MANIKHDTLSANTVATITLDRDCQYVEILNRSGSAEIYIGMDGAVPTVGGDDFDVLPAAISSCRLTSRKQGNTIVKLISSGTPTYTVKAD